MAEKDVEMKLTELKGRVSHPNVRVIEINTGGMWDEKQWRIQYHNFVYETCKHCKENPDTRWGYDKYICPRVVVAFNEGGYCSAGVCLDCIIEAEEKLNKGEIEDGI